MEKRCFYLKIFVSVGGDIPIGKEYDLVVYLKDYATISYKKELSGETNSLKRLASLSEKLQTLVVSPFDTDNYGVLKRSAGVFDRGKLLGISDASVAYEDSPYMPGVSEGVYETEFGKLGVIVGEDFYSYDTMRSYAVCGVKLAVVLKRELKTETDSIVLRAYSFLLGLPTVLLAKDRIISADFKGNLVFDGRKSAEFELPSLSEYYLKISKTRFSVK